MRHASDLLLALGTALAATVLRLEALIGSYGVVPLGSALEAVQVKLAALGPWLHGGRLAWPLLGERAGDPLAYLNNARAMTWFYQGRAREPVFNYATRWWLTLTGNADIAVSAASTVFSIFCAPATFLLGRVAFGPVVGLIAALLVAIEPELISWGVQGWRDDTFTFFFLAFGATWMLFRDKPTRMRAAMLAVTTSLTLLTRLTALSFVAPAFLVLLWDARVKRALRSTLFRRLAIVSGVTALMVSPYLINCWIALGDPLVAVNRNTDFYRARAGEVVDERMRTDTYLASLVREHPVATADTLVQGLTTYPFRNKFRGLQVWDQRLPTALRWLTVAGLLTWLWTPHGRALLLLLGTSLLPYAFTWEIRGGAEWRFTMHAYPIYLIAAASFATAVTTAIVRLAKGERPRTRIVGLRTAASLLLAFLLAGMLLWMPYPRLRETLAHEGAATISPGWRDTVFFRQDWEHPVERDGAASRVSRGGRARIWVPLVPGRAYRLTASVAPLPGPDRDRLFLRVYLNGARVFFGRFPGAGFSDVAFDLEPGAVESRSNVIEFRADRLPRGTEVATAADGQDQATTLRIELRHLGIALQPESQHGELKSDRRRDVRGEASE